MAIAWPVSKTPVYTSIVGARKIDDVDILARAGDWELSSKDISEIEQIQGTHRLYMKDQEVPERSVWHEERRKANSEGT